MTTTTALPTLLEANPRGKSTVTQLALGTMAKYRGTVAPGQVSAASAHTLRYLTSTPYATCDANGVWKLTDAGWVAYAVHASRVLTADDGAPAHVVAHVAAQWAEEAEHHEATGTWRL